MPRRSVFLLLLVATVASADDIRFNPPTPDSQTHVVAYLGDPTPCSPQSVTPVVDGSTILIKIVVPCLLPTCCPTPVSVDLGILPSGIYAVTATMNGSLLAQATLVVRDLLPQFEIVPNVTYSGAPDSIRLTGKNLALCTGPGQCVIPTVRFGVAVAEVVSTSAEEIIVRAPAGDPGPVDVTIDRGDAMLRSVGAFYYIPVSAEPNPTFYEPVLFPVIFAGPGAFGSRWDTEVVLRNENDYAVTLQTGSIFNAGCSPICDSRPQAFSTVKLDGAVYRTGYIQLVPRQAAPRLHFGVLVRDLSRQAKALGTEIPVIRESQFFDDELELLNVPTDPRFRVGLRLYSFESNRFPFAPFPALYVEILSESVQFVGVVRAIALHGDVGYSTTPEYAQISDLVAAYPQLAGKGPLRILISAVTKGQAPFWGFVTVTNNDTQQVTTITPQ